MPRRVETGGMELGTTIPTGCTDEYAVPPEAMREWARGADEAGLAGLWLIDHLVKPDTYVTSVLNPMVALSHAAAVTERIPLGTSILLLPVRGAPTTAEAALSLQYLADRELTLGLGAGYVPEEFELTGVPRRERGPRLSEGIEVLGALFEGEASYDGRFHSFEGITIDPVPEDPPRLLAGGASIWTDGELPEPMLDRIVFSDGWIAPPMDPDHAAEDWATIADHARERGVDPDSLDRVALSYTHVVDTADRERAHEEQAAAFAEFFSPDRGFEHAREGCLVGSLDDIHDRLARYERHGFDQVIAGPAAHEPAELERQLALLTDEVAGSW
jgi:alkanesulfonate monooxygenase SsuD/methylene tetrahydromethanopterin reductase-like flavin-dependent oxidoreductase (luciferase family)